MSGLVFPHLLHSQHSLFFILFFNDSFLRDAAIVYGRRVSCELCTVGDILSLVSLKDCRLVSILVLSVSCYPMQHSINKQVTISTNH